MSNLSNTTEHNDENYEFIRDCVKKVHKATPKHEDNELPEDINDILIDIKKKMKINATLGRGYVNTSYPTGVGVDNYLSIMVKELNKTFPKCVISMDIMLFEKSKPHIHPSKIYVDINKNITDTLIKYSIDSYEYTLTGIKVSLPSYI